MSTAKPSVVTIEHLSRSPSPSESLTSSSSFDPNDSKHLQEDLAGKDKNRPILGLRDLTKMAVSDRRRRSTKTTTGTAGGTVSLPGSTRSSLDIQRPIEIRRGSDMGQGGLGPSFAKDVGIRGYKVVGGSNWDDDAKVGAYVVYDIEIITRNGGSICILRRYTDFVRLRSALKAKHPHLRKAIPSLPGKAHMSKFSPKFLADRQPRLQRFLRAVMLHPEMGQGGEGSVIGQWVLDTSTQRNAR